MKKMSVHVGAERFPWIVKTKFDARRYILALEVPVRHLFFNTVTRADVLAWMVTARWGLAEGQWLLGECYSTGTVVKPDPKKHLRWLLASARQDYAPAQEALGWHYVSKHHKWYEREAEKGVVWLARAAEHNYARAQKVLGVCYWHGNGVTQDARKALGLFQKAAGQQFKQSFEILAMWYSRGEFVDQDVKKGKWYSRRARRREAFVRVWLKKSLATAHAEYLNYRLG